jgi:hypothetical protein
MNDLFPWLGETDDEDISNNEEFIVDPDGYETSENNSYDIDQPDSEDDEITDNECEPSRSQDGVVDHMISTILDAVFGEDDEDDLE